MNVNLVNSNGSSYSEYLDKFEVKVARKSGKRVTVSCREKEPKLSYLSFSLPLERAQQLGYALLMAAAGDMEPARFDVTEKSRVSFDVATDEVHIKENQ